MRFGQVKSGTLNQCFSQEWALCRLTRWSMMEVPVAFLLPMVQLCWCKQITIYTEHRCHCVDTACLSSGTFCSEILSVWMESCVFEKKRGGKMKRPGDVNEQTQRRRSCGHALLTRSFRASAQFYAQLPLYQALFPLPVYRSENKV